MSQLGARDAEPLGRELEFQRAMHLAGECSLLAIYGLPGIGKTWFAERFAAIYDQVIQSSASHHCDLPSILEVVYAELGVDTLDAVRQQLDKGNAAWVIDAAEGLSEKCTIALADFADTLERGRIVVTSRRKLTLPGRRVGAIRLRGLSPRKSREIAGAIAERLAWDERLVARAHEITAGRPWLTEVLVDPATSWARDPIATAIDSLESSDQFQLAKLAVLGTSSNLGRDTENSRLVSDFFIEGAVGCYQLSREVESLLRRREDWVFDRALDFAAKSVRSGRELSGRVLGAAAEAARDSGRDDLVGLFASHAGETQPEHTDWQPLDPGDASPRAQLRRGVFVAKGWLAKMCAPLRGSPETAELNGYANGDEASAAALALAARLVFGVETVEAAAARSLARACGPGAPEAAVLLVASAMAGDDPHALERLLDELDDLPATTSEVTDLARAAAELNAGDFDVAADHFDTLVRTWQTRGEKWLAWIARGLRVWTLVGSGRDGEGESAVGDLLDDADGLGWSVLDTWADSLLEARQTTPESLAEVCRQPALSPIQAVPIGALATLANVEVDELEKWCQNRSPSWRLARDRLLLAVAHLAGGSVAALPIVEKLLAAVVASPAATTNPELGQLLVLAQASLARIGGEHDRSAEILAAASPSVEHSGLAGMALSAAVRGDFESKHSGPLLARLGLDASPRVLLTHRGNERLLARAKAIEIASECDLAVDVGADEIWVGNTKSRGRPMACLLLARLVFAGGAPVSPEDMFFSLRGVEYHPLDHRNTLYVTVSRVRRLLGKLLPEREVIETVSSGWRLAADLNACVISPAA